MTRPRLLFAAGFTLLAAASWGMGWLTAAGGRIW